MQNFLEQTITEIYSKHKSLEDFVFILPSRRAGLFLKKTIAQINTKTQFAPQILSIEEFIENISGLSYANNTEQLFELYYTYLEQTKDNPDGFIEFSKWGQTLLQDINEIDRYLIDASKLFSNLSAIQEIDHWYVTSEKTEMIEDYVHFWNNLEHLYTSFNQRLLEQKRGHQGLVYRKAYEHINTYLEATKKKNHIFIGFNALNTAETKIIQRILQNPNAKIYWDIDTYLLEDQVHDASYFIRKHLKTWPYLKKHGLKGPSSNLLSDKHIEIVGIPKNISQVKYVGNLLKGIRQDSTETLKQTAIILSDESLLNPLINSIPDEIDKVNITMGYPLNKTPFDSFFRLFFEFHNNKGLEGWYHKNVVSFLADPNTRLLFSNEEENMAEVLTRQIKGNNLTYIQDKYIFELFQGRDLELINLIFSNNPSPKKLIKDCIELISILKTKLQESNNVLALEQLFKFHNVFNQIMMLLQAHDFIKDIKSLQTIFKELLSIESLDFKGDPVEGLQIMGMLESRNLDFETVIITSVNEGILPSGKTNNSFIPFDLKKAFGLPTFKEKDAVYTYHFYRLLQRAKNIYLLYNTEPDVLLGGEKSRLLHQLSTDENFTGKIKEYIAIPEIKPSQNKKGIINKNDSLITLVQEHAKRGFSPSSLSNYIRDPFAFYKQNLLGIDTSLEVEETLAANTFGTIIHDTLEDLYKPHVGVYLTEELLKASKHKIKDLVKKHFDRTYSDQIVLKGKNLIAFNVIINYVQKFIDAEINEVKQHKIKILGLEDNMRITLDIPEIEYPIHLKGKLDRIDEKDGVLRIIDYKSGKVLQNQVEVVEWPEITENYNLSKAFQLLCYALMYNGKFATGQMTAGIISFKNLNSGLLHFATKERNSRTKERSITANTLAQFQVELKRLILEICNPNIPFSEKEV